MQLLSTTILIAEKPMLDNAFEILLTWYVQTKQDTPFRFDELQKIFYSIKYGAMIEESENYIEYCYRWQNEIWSLNAGNYYDRLCKKYSIYPNYLNLS